MRVFLILLFFLITQPIFAQNERVDSHYQKGTLKEGYKESIWEYYDKPGELALKIDYSSAKLLFLKPDTSEYIIKINDQWTKSKLDVQPRYIGSMHDFKKLQSTIRYPAEARTKETAGKFYITFEIDTIGRAGNYQVINDIGNQCSEEVIKALRTIPNYWLTAQKEGKLYPSKFILPVTFKMTVNGREIRPRKNKLIESPLAKELDELVISVMGVTRTTIR